MFLRGFIEHNTDGILIFDPVTSNPLTKSYNVSFNFLVCRLDYISQFLFGLIKKLCSKITNMQFEILVNIFVYIAKTIRFKIAWRNVWT